MNNEERAIYLRQAFTAAGIDAPDEFLSRLAGEIGDSLETHEILWDELDPQTFQNWLESDIASFQDYMEINEREPWWDDDYAESARCALESALGGKLFAEWPEVQKQALERAENIAQNLSLNVPIEFSHSFRTGEKQRCAFMLGTPEDVDSEYGTTENFAQWFIDDNPLAFHKDTGLGALSWLVQSQGKTLADIKKGRGEFAKSLLRELGEFGDYRPGAPVLCAMLDIKAAEHFKEGGSLKIGADAGCGLFAPWSGNAGIFEIRLEKPVIIDKSVIRAICAAGAKQGNAMIESLNSALAADDYGRNSDAKSADEPAAKPMTFARAARERKKSENMVKPS